MFCLLDGGMRGSPRPKLGGPSRRRMSGVPNWPEGGRGVLVVAARSMVCILFPMLDGVPMRSRLNAIATVAGALAAVVLCAARNARRVIRRDTRRPTGCDHRGRGWVSGG